MRASIRGFAILLSLLSSLSHADHGVTWIDADGKEFSPGWRTESERVTSGAAPYLRVWMELPKGYVLKKVRGAELSLSEESQKAPFEKNSEAEIHLLETELATSHAGIEVLFPDGKVYNLGLVVAANPDGVVGSLEKGPWSITPGVGLTFLSYEQRETARVLSMSQWNLTAKVSASYAWKPGKVDLSGNVFGTLAPFGMSPSQVTSARFFGVNVRAGFYLPVNWLNAEWSLSPGWYTWGMLVRDGNYGISAMTGPQLHLVMRRSQIAYPYALYLKYAAIQEKVGLPSFGSSEIAAGGSVRLSGPRTRRPVSITMDVSRSNIGVGGVSIRMSTYSAGAQIEF